jgi:hypothetical protein
MTRQLSVYPVPPSDGNPMVGRELGALGVAVAKDNLRLGQPLNDLPTGSIVHFHWSSVIYASPDHRKAERRLDLWTSFLEEIGSRCRIVWTAHNLFPHDNPFPDLGREARRILIRHCAAAGRVIFWRRSLARFPRYQSCRTQTTRPNIPAAGSTGGKI